MAKTETDRPTGVKLPEGWTWDRVEQQRAKWGLGADLIPIAHVAGVVAWGTINSVRRRAA